MLTIRLHPQGRKHKKTYRIVVAQKHHHVSKKVLVNLGFYDPVSKDFKINKELLQKYLDSRVEVSESALSLFKKHSLV
jgi:ribosomal protein S16